MNTAADVLRSYCEQNKLTESEFRQHRCVLPCICECEAGPHWAAVMHTAVLDHLAYHCPTSQQLQAMIDAALTESARAQITTVGGIEKHAVYHSGLLDTSPDLLPCPFCGSDGAFTDGRLPSHRIDEYTVAAQCSNTSCGVRTPEHYKDRASAAYAWNRRPEDPAKRP